MLKGKSNLEIKSGKSGEKIKAFSNLPVESLSIFFERLLKKLDIPSNNIIIQYESYKVKPALDSPKDAQEINLDFDKYNVLIPGNLSFKRITGAVKKEFDDYIIPSGSNLDYYSFSVKNNCLCLYFFYNSDLFLKAVFIVKDAGKNQISGENGYSGSGFGSIKQYVDSPKIALDIDDVGYNEKLVDGLIALHTVITFAVFPRATFSRQIDVRLHKLGYETIMHIPMESVDTKLFPGDGALYVSMSNNKIKYKILTDISMLPYIDGANNHEGSMFTSDRQKICYAVSVFKSDNLFFLDSLTDKNSYAYSCALKAGMPAARRDVFIDDDASVKYIDKQLLIARSLAKSYKRVIVIGHPRPKTLAALIKEIPKLKKEGYKFVPLCEFLR